MPDTGDNMGFQGNNQEYVDQQKMLALLQAFFQSRGSIGGGGLYQPSMSSVHGLPNLSGLNSSRPVPKFSPEMFEGVLSGKLPTHTPNFSGTLGLPNMENLKEGRPLGGSIGNVGSGSKTPGGGFFGKMGIGSILNALLAVLFGGQAVQSLGQGLGMWDSEGEKQRRHERQQGLANLGGQAMLQADSQHERALARGDRLLDQQLGVADRNEARRSQADMLRFMLMSQMAGRGGVNAQAQPQSPLPFLAEAGLI